MKYDRKFNYNFGWYNTPNGSEWKEPRNMEYKALEQELRRNRKELRKTNDQEAARAYINRNHELMEEMSKR